MAKNSWIVRTDYSSICVGKLAAFREIQSCLDLYPNGIRYFIYGEHFAFFLLEGFQGFENLLPHKILDFFETEPKDIVAALETWMDMIDWKSLDEPRGYSDFWEGFYISITHTFDNKPRIPAIGIRPILVGAEYPLSVN